MNKGTHILQALVSQSLHNSNNNLISTVVSTGWPQSISVH